MSRRVSIFGSSFVTPPLYQPETTAYLTAVGIPADGSVTIYGITGLQVWQAVDTGIVALKAADIYGPTWTGWTVGKANLLALYPVIGGSAATHKFNASNPLDTDAAFRLQFFGGWTHSNTGMKPNGTNAYADTFVNPNLQSAFMNATSGSAGVYLRENNNASIGDLGNYNATGASNLAIMAKFQASNDAYYRAMNTADILVTPVTDARGMTIINTRTTNSRRFVKNGVLLNTNTNATSSPPESRKIVLASLNATQFRSAREQAGAFIASGLTDAQELALRNFFQNLNTALNRQV
jgi:hypothetical protein